ncbi:MAG TPA: M20/M25/M40 family metallo-hydrolase [Thermoleophilaceae bacterium]
MSDERLPGTLEASLLRDDVVALTTQLVAIDSVNPSLVPGGAGEAQIATFVAGWARQAGLEAELTTGTPARPSVIVRAPGTGGGASLLLCAHMDTVGVEGMTDPHAPRVDGDRLYGRGAYDMKAGLAAALVACRELAREGVAGDVVVAAVADEEHASLGVQEVLSSIGADAAIVTEPTELEVVVAHKGFVWAEFEVTGRAAHGSRPHLGVDAIVKTGPILTAIGDLDAALGARTHPLLGRGSVHASLIEGGVEMSSYPARCVLGLERRTLPGDTAGAVEDELASLLDSCRAADPELVATQRTVLVREPFEVDQDADVVEVVREAAAAVLPSAPAIGGASYWADAAFIAAAGIPTVMFGPGGEGAHAAEEWVSISDTVAVTRTLIAAGTRLCA